MQITSGDMPMLSDLQLVYMGPRNSTQLLKINTTKFQVEREPVYNILINLTSYRILAPHPLSLSLRSLSIVASGERGGGGGQSPA